MVFFTIKISIYVMNIPGVSVSLQGQLHRKLNSSVIFMRVFSLFCSLSVHSALMQSPSKPLMSMA